MTNQTPFASLVKKDKVFPVRNKPGNDDASQSGAGQLPNESREEYSLLVKWTMSGEPDPYVWAKDDPDMCVMIEDNKWATRARAIRGSTMDALRFGLINKQTAIFNKLMGVQEELLEKYADEDLSPQERHASLGMLLKIARVQTAHLEVIGVTDNSSKILIDNRQATIQASVSEVGKALGGPLPSSSFSEYVDEK